MSELIYDGFDVRQIQHKLRRLRETKANIRKYGNGKLLVGLETQIAYLERVLQSPDHGVSDIGMTEA